MLLRFLGACRHLLIVPVIGCILLTLGVVVMGFGRILTAGVEVIRAGDFSAKAAKAMSLNVIEIIDLFLIGTVAYITAMGLYKLFIGGTDVRLPMRLQITSLKDLEDKIIGVLVAALAVAFLGHAAGGDEASALLNYGGGIALVIAALGFFVKAGDKKAAPKDES
jgi:uncharacterized membrane protein YqhA